MEIFAGIELGGTNTVWAVGRGSAELVASGELPTTGPQETLFRAQDEIEARLGDERLVAIGIGAFGPIADLDPRSPTYGTIGNTPKSGWSGAAIVQLVRARLDVPVALDTDVNAAALGERLWGAGRGLSDLVYLTIGTGIGGGAIASGTIVHGAGHPEMGHMYMPLHERDVESGFRGVCPFHDRCLEGLASGGALLERFGRPPEELAPDHEAWEIEAHYVGHAVANLAFAYRPQRFILGGGVMQAAGLLERTRAAAVALLGPEYISVGDSSRFIVAPGLGDLSGIHGAIALAARAAGETSTAVRAS
jgi:fructokinase